MSRIRKAGCALLVAAVSVAASLLAVELGLRVLAPQPLLRDPDGAFEPDADLGARLKAGWSGRHVTTEFACDWRVNRDGHRGPRAGERGRPVLRIAALGDSFTFGYGVQEEQAWPRRLEQLLRERAQGGGVEVLNLGVGGYGTAQEARLLRRRWEALRPDLAIVALYVGNDPADDARETARRAAAASQRPAAADAPGRGPSSMEPLKRWLGSRLHSYSFVATRADELLVRLGLRNLVYPFEMEVLLAPEPPHVAQAWTATGRALSDLAALPGEGGPRVLVVVVPMKHQASDAVWARVESYYGSLAGAAARDGFDRLLPQRRVEDLCARAGVARLDLLEGLRASAPPGGDAADLYWPRDQHWSPAGHEAAARLIARHLDAMGLSGVATGSGSR